jgi:glycosyltransferase involved in cell wall biosynthesis
MKLSYAITVCNEFDEIIKLLTQLLNYKSDNSEIVVLLDTPKASEELIEYLELQANADKITLIESEFDSDFAQWKNFLNSQCKGEWIFQLDADELLSPNLIVNLEDILDANVDKEMIAVPRINIVNGLTEEHVQKWGWNVNERGWVNFPDFQTRLYKNNSEKIGWNGKVHERIVGFESYTSLPTDELYCIKHIKEIAKQEKQNNYYDTL